MIKKECRDQRWKPLAFKNDGPQVSHLFFADDLLLFAEANIAQVERIKKVMQSFCLISGHRINLQKSKAFFSKNVNFHRASSLSERMGISTTSNLGRYMGVPLIHERVTINTYGHITKKVRTKLSAWKGRFLSMAGRTVLIKSVLAALPSYQMQTTLLPKALVHEIERISRSFFWSQDAQARKIHLIAWEKVKRSKKEGGLGFKKLVLQNKAFIMKLCWGLITKPGAL